VELVELDLSYGGVLEQLPDDVFLSLKKLETLYLGGNQLKLLPPSLFDPENGSGASLMHLDVHGNALKTMPPATGCCTALLSLNLGRNQLRTLPSELAMCSDLRSLQVYKNDLQLPLPEAFQTAYLHLENLPDVLRRSLPHLERLWLGCAPLVAVPTGGASGGARRT
jgi:adenylate cyclase